LGYLVAPPGDMEKTVLGVFKRQFILSQTQLTAYQSLKASRCYNHFASPVATETDQKLMTKTDEKNETKRIFAFLRLSGRSRPDRR
jgi:hypothetical protein